MNDPRLILPPPAKRALTKGLPFKVASAVWELVDGGLKLEPRRAGKPLNPPFAGRRVARRSSYRVRYRIDEEARTVVILVVQGRTDAYRSSGHA
ncbi:Toxin RelG [Nocardiopsis dassonvillei]|uniref:type II toxin-antitoxin system RelE family toxin n=1 Tax=Nocardiopsis dassonvillei TaxID=2014 RepID=UPI003F549ECB